MFDEKGYRLGYGYGYYDRFLKGIPKSIPKIGLAYDFQVIKKIPHKKHDIPVDIIITERKITNINSNKK